MRILSSDYTTTTPELWNQNWEKLSAQQVKKIVFDFSGRYCALVLGNGSVELWDIWQAQSSATEILFPFVVHSSVSTLAASWSRGSSCFISIFELRASRPANASVLILYDVKRNRALGSCRYP